MISGNFNILQASNLFVWERFFLWARITSIPVTGITNGTPYINLTSSPYAGINLFASTGGGVNVGNGPLNVVGGGGDIAIFQQGALLSEDNVTGHAGTNLQFNLFGATNTNPNKYTIQEGPQSSMQASNIQAMIMAASNSITVQGSNIYTLLPGANITFVTNGNEMTIGSSGGKSGNAAMRRARRPGQQ